MICIRFSIAVISSSIDGSFPVLMFRPTRVCLFGLFFSCFQFYVLLSPYLCFISFYILIYMF